MPNSVIIGRLRVVEPDHIILGGNVRIRNGRVARIGRGSKVYRSSSRGGGVGYDPWWAGAWRDGAACVAGHTLVIDGGAVR
jgi:hypothetical protein